MRDFALGKGPRNQKFESWVDEWRVWFNKAERLSLTDEATAMDDFANAINVFDESLSDHLALTSFASIDDTVSASVKRIRDKSSIKKKSTGTKMSFASPTLNEVPATKQPDEKPRKRCVCGKIHSDAKCYYLNPSIAPSDWNGQRFVTEKINKKLKDD